MVAFPCRAHAIKQLVAGSASISSRVARDRCDERPQAQVHPEVEASSSDFDEVTARYKEYGIEIKKRFGSCGLFFLLFRIEL